MSEAHTRLLSRRSSATCARPRGRLPEDWVASQRRRDIDRTDGDVETLSARIAGIRTWTYVSQRAPGWRTPGSGRSARARSRTGCPTPCTSGSPSSSWTGRARSSRATTRTSSDERGRRRRGAGAGPEGRPARRLPLPARPGGARRLAGAARRREPRALGPGARARGALEREDGAVVRPRAEGRGPVAGRRGGSARRRARARSSRGSTSCPRTSSTRRCGSACGGASPAGSSRTCAQALLAALRAARRRATGRRPRPRLRPRRGTGRRVPSLRRAAGRGPDAGRPARPSARLGVTVGRLSLFLPALLRPDAARLRARLFAVHARGARPRAAPTARRPSPSTRASPPPSTWPAATCPPARAPSGSIAWSAPPPWLRGSPARAPSSPRGTSRRSSAAPPTRCRRC